MRSLGPVSVAALVLVAACSGSDGDADDAPPDATVAETVADTQAPDEPVETEPVDTEPVEEPVDTEPVDTEPVDTEPVDEPVDTEPEPEAEDDGFSIDGPAQVRPSCASLAPGINEFTLEAGGFARDVRMYVPALVSSDPAPVVLNWHGLGSNGPEQAVYTGYETLAEQEGFLVVHATGAAVGGANSWELAQFDTDERDDLAFADALIDTVVEDWCGDETRIYSTGMSNGGLFTSELVCNRSERIAAAVSVAGLSHVDECDPVRPVPYAAYHGTADDVVPFGGGEPSVLLPPETVDALIGDGTPNEFAEFAVDNGCDAEPTRTEETAEVVRYDYVGCEGDVPMTFYEIVGGGHTWPSSPIASEDAPLEESGFTFDVDATADAWEFMSQHSL